MNGPTITNLTLTPLPPAYLPVVSWQASEDSVLVSHDGERFMVAMCGGGTIDCFSASRPELLAMFALAPETVRKLEQLEALATSHATDTDALPVPADVLALIPLVEQEAARLAWERCLSQAQRRVAVDQPASAALVASWLRELVQQGAPHSAVEKPLSFPHPAMCPQIRNHGHIEYPTKPNHA